MDDIPMDYDSVEYLFPEFNAIKDKVKFQIEKFDGEQAILKANRLLRSSRLTRTQGRPSMPSRHRRPWAYREREP